MQAKQNTREQVAYPISKKNLNQIKLPRLRLKKRAIHSKNPYKIKPIKFQDESKIPKKILDGFMLLRVTKNDLPHEIIKCKMSKMNINGVNVEDTYFFINLVDLDLSENEINIEDLVNFVNLQTLILSYNRIRNIILTEEITFKNLDTLDLSFNYLTQQAIENLQYIPKLRKLVLENNELTDLPETMGAFQSLEELILDGNQFESNNSAANFWFTLASIKRLQVLSLARNSLRGIHTEKLIAGNFSNLAVLDFSFNAVENQHNLICARNFKNLQKLIVTGNPFAMIQEHKGLEMEVYARTGGIVINEDVEKYYLRQKNDKNRLKIKFDQLRKVENDDFKRKQKDYFMGVEMPQITIKQTDQQSNQQQNEFEDQNSYINENKNEQGEEVMFITQNPGNNINSIPIINTNSIVGNNTNSILQKHQINSKQVQSIEISSQKKTQAVNKEGMNYEKFIETAREQLGDNKEYEQAYDLNSAYKVLKNMVRKPNDDVKFQDQHYLKPTESIQRYKFKDQSVSLISAEQIENYEKKKSLIGQNESQQDKQNSNNYKLTVENVNEDSNNNLYQENQL